MFRCGARIERRRGRWSERAGNTKVTVLLVMGALSRIRGCFGVVVVVVMMLMMLMMMSLGM